MTQPVSVTRLRSKAVGVYVIALIAGVAAAWAAHEHIQMREHEIESQAQVDVVERVAIASDLDAGTRIQVDHLAARDIPRSWVPDNAFEVNAVDQVVGQRLATTLKRGDVLLSTHIAVDEPLPISDLVAPGRRAVTLPVGEIQAATGLLRVGDLIDLYVSFAHQGQHVTAPLAQSVRVLALRADVVPAVITLDASKQDAIKLVAARHAGALTAMLRSRDDTAVSSAAPSGDLAALIGIERPVAVKQTVIPVMYGDRMHIQTPFTDSTSSEPRSPSNPSSQRRIDSVGQFPEVQEK